MTTTVAVIGASLSMDRSANNWPELLRGRLQVGHGNVQVALFGMQGTGSSYWIASGWVARCAAIRPNIVMIDPTADASPGQNTSVAQSMANMLAIIDAIVAKNDAVKIYMMTMNRMRSDAVQFSNVGAYYANNAAIMAQRPLNVMGHVDCYGAWGDPALHPEEYAPSDPVHPLLAGNLRVTIPTVSATLAPLIS